MKQLVISACAAIAGALITLAFAGMQSSPARAQTAAQPGASWGIVPTPGSTTTSETAWLLNSRTGELDYCWSDLGGRNCQRMPKPMAPFNSN